MRALIVGAGAIGRGFVPWALEGVEIDFFDSSEQLMSEMSAAGGYFSHMTHKGKLDSKFVRPLVSTSDPSELTYPEYDVAFIAVGPRNVVSLTKELHKVRGPIFSLENDPLTVELLRNHLARADIFFGVPDVITSSTASPVNLRNDKLSLHTEDGVLYLEDSNLCSTNVKTFLTKVEWLEPERLKAEWDAKLYLHNTPHCVAAYLGFLLGKEYVHETFENQFAQKVISGVINEMLSSLKLSTDHDHDFLHEYAAKELRRFSNSLLFDPILRVAREPLRKLQQNGRLTGALRLCLLNGVEPYNLMLGISAALQYREPRDPDSRHMDAVHELGASLFMKYHLGIQPEALESLFIEKHYAAASKYLNRGLI